MKPGRGIFGIGMKPKKSDKKESTILNDSQKNSLDMVFLETTVEKMAEQMAGLESRLEEAEKKINYIRAFGPKY